MKTDGVPVTGLRHAAAAQQERHSYFKCEQGHVGKYSSYCVLRRSLHTTATLGYSSEVYRNFAPIMTTLDLEGYSAAVPPTRHWDTGHIYFTFSNVNAVMHLFMICYCAQVKSKIMGEL